MDVEEDFPRTAVVNLQPLGEPRRRTEDGSHSRSYVATRIGASSQTSAKDAASALRGRLPSADSIEVGSLLLGSVAMIAPNGLRIHLPGGMSGFARASDIIDVADKAGAPRMETILSSSFVVGSHVIVSVLESKKGFLSLSMKPSVINKALRLDCITQGVVLPACLKAHEEHGSILAFNLRDRADLKGFVKHADSRDTENADSDAAISEHNCINESCVKKAKKNPRITSTADLPLYSTVYVVVETVNLERNVVTCRWAWQSDIPVSMDLQLPLVCVLPGLLLVGEITDIHHPASRLIGTAESLTNYGFDIKCLNSLSATVPALHSVTSYSGGLDNKETDNEKPKQEESLSDSTTDVPKGRKKRKAQEDEDAVTCEPPMGIEDHVIGRVIYVDHWQKTIYVSLLSHIVQWKGRPGNSRKVLPTPTRTFAKAVRSIPHSGIIFALCDNKSPSEDQEEMVFDNRNLAYCELSQLSDDAAGTTGKGMKSHALKTAMTFTNGSVHRAMQLDYDFFTRFVRVSMRESLLEETIVSPFQLAAGTAVNAEVTKIANTGITVSISKLVHGKVPLEHLTDVPLPQVPDRYSVGAALKLRVLRFDHVHNNLVLTAKRTMRKDPMPVTSFEQLSVGKEVLGYISRIRRNADTEATDLSDNVMVRFYNELHTTLDQSELKEAKANSIELNNGDVVRAVVTRVDQKRRAFYVTLTPQKMSALKSMAEAKKKRKREIRREACKKAFTNYVSSRKRSKAAK